MKRIQCLLVAPMLLVSVWCSAEIAVIVSADSPLASLTKDEVSDIFLGKSPTFPDGREAVPLDFKDGNSTKAEFHKSTTGKNMSQLKAYWSKMLFSGKGVPPKEVDGISEMVSLVAKNPNLIGYVDGASADGSVKVVAKF